MFHVSQLKQYVPDPLHVLQPEVLEMDDSLSYEERPVKVLDEKTRDTRRKSVKMLKVQWSNHSPEEATWELEDVLKERYPQFFNSGQYDWISCVRIKVSYLRCVILCIELAM